MTLTGLVFIAFLTSTNALKLLSEECEDCNENGPWWPLFRPSQIIKSEFPEHRRQFKSEEASGSYEHTLPSSREEGEGHVEWDHYDDVSKVSTVPNNSLEHKSSGERPYPQGNSRSGEEQGDPKTKKMDSREEDASFKIAEASVGGFFEKGSFSPSRDRLSDDFDVSKDFPFANDDSINSFEFPSSRYAFGRQNKQVATSYAAFSSVFAKPKPVNLQGRDLLHPKVDSYLPNYVHGERRTPVSHFKFVNRLNATGQYIAHQQDRIDPGVGLLSTNKYNPGVLWITHRTPQKPLSRSSQLPPIIPPQNQLSPFVPLDHPVYRYVKHHGGKGAFNQLSIAPNRRQQNFLQESLGNASLQKEMDSSPVQVHIQNHETLVRHVVPTKSPFSDTFWKESRKVETFQPPPPLTPVKRTFYIIKKKQNNVGLRRIGRRTPSYVYIVKDKKRIS